MQLIAILSYAQHSLIGIYHLLKVHLSIHNKGKGRVGIEVLIQLYSLLGCKVRLSIYRGEDSASKVATHRHKVNIAIKCWLQSLQRTAYLYKVLMLKGFVYRDIIATPAKVCSSTWLYARACRARNCCNMHLALQQSISCKRQKSKLNSCCKATRIGKAEGLRNTVAVNLWQSIDIAVALIAVVLRKVNNLQRCRLRILLPELTAMAVRRTEEKQVYSRQIVLIRKAELCLTDKSSVNIT